MAKKDFSNSQNPALIPALQFITTENEDVPEKKEPRKPAAQPRPKMEKARETKAPVQTPIERERKTKRLNLLLRPSVMENLQKIAVMQRTSVNDLINEVMLDYTRKHKDQVLQHDEIFGASNPK